MLSVAARAGLRAGRTRHSNGAAARGSLRTVSTIRSVRPTTPVSGIGIRSSLARAMSHNFGGASTVRPDADKVLQDIADYVHNYKIDSELAFETARLCLIDTIGCGLEALRFPECTKLLGPVVEGTVVPNGMHSIHFPNTFTRHTQAPGFPELITNSTPYEELSTSVLLFAGWILMTVSLPRSVCLIYLIRIYVL